MGTGKVKIKKDRIETEWGTETIAHRLDEKQKLRDAFTKEISFWDEKEKDPRKKLKPKKLSEDHPIAIAYRKYKTDWNNIRAVAATYGYYSFLDVWKLLEDNSQFKDIDDSSFQTCRYIYEAQKKHPSWKVQRAIKENLPWLAILQKIDPSKIHYGVNWYNVQRTKNKKLPAGTGESIYPIPYIRVINAIREKHHRLFVKKNKLFVEWYKNHVGRSYNNYWDDFLNKTKKFLEKK